MLVLHQAARVVGCDGGKNGTQDVVRELVPGHANLGPLDPPRPIRRQAALSGRVAFRAHPLLTPRVLVVLGIVDSVACEGAAGMSKRLE